MIQPSVYEYIKTEESAFETDEVQVGDNWYWNFRNHVQLIFHLKNGVFYTGENNWLRAFKNIMEPILNLGYWAEDIEVKDVAFYIENETGRVLSFFVKKYHDEVYVKENDIDTFFDEVTESDLDFGGALVQETDKLPEVLQLNSIAFCDQTDILSGPICFKHDFTPDKLRSMSKLGWGDEKNGATISIEELITIAEPQSRGYGMDTKKNRTPGKTIEVYVLKGCLPEHYMKDNDEMENYYDQVQIVAFYYDKESKKQGVTLYRKEGEEGTIKFYTSKKVYGRALGRGEGEGLLHPQVWTNFLTIHKTNLLESASKTPLFTDDQSYVSKNKVQNMENLEITVIDPTSKFGIQQIPTASPLNIQLMEKSINEWYEQGQLTGSAFDPIIGKQASSGTTFRGQERSVQQGNGLHKRRMGQRAKFFEGVYRDDIIPKIVKQIKKGKKFLATFTTEELAWVSDQLAVNYANRRVAEAVLYEDGDLPDVELLKKEFVEIFAKKGNKHLIEILSKEFEGVEVKMGINIASKQKDLGAMSDKILSIFQFAFSNPQGFIQTMQIPGMAKSFNDILEYGGLSPVDFSTVLNVPMNTGTTPQDGQIPNSVPTPATA